ncbi:putative transcription factor interactor and regulator CCHC(Zn) family [Rosa chinensis]|uniref:Putative transcription factor interactor and regulator CCHC(Zn) family n=1 Tax=Rosa chinensis TaxID=74649 RepID=A0A2P6QZA8_ROSCH|nr:nuclear export mediator factor Nemf [Rosa chinensis]PRQ39528.1 putative transcription factor interactor and regulator CCHC(Zn) family [Rosa chinensis]
MVKVRMNTADVAAEVKCLRRLIGMRCANVYDLSPKTYMLKLMNSSGVTESGESEKVFLLIESGVRLHTTAYVRDKSNTPSGFTLKIRKHIRTRRLEDVRQLGYDRIILFQFGLGANAYYVILELYAQGNIILADSEYMVMTLLRSHRDDDKGVAIMSRHHYPIEICRVFERTTAAKLQEALTYSKEPDNNESVKDSEGRNDASDAPKEKKGGRKGGKPVESSKKPGDAKAKQATLKNVLGDGLGYGPALSEHIILDAGLVPNTKVGKDEKLDDNTLKLLLEAVTKFEDWLHDVISGEKVPEGYILMQHKNSGKNGPPSEPGSSGQIYDEFCPILLNQFKSREYVQFETFDASLDEFYSKIESQRSEQQQKAKESSATQRLNKIRVDQENRVHMLRKEVDQCVKMAELIEYNLEDVDAAILAVRVALAKGMSWEDLARMVKEEKKSGNPIAGLIDKLYLERNCMTLLLSNNLDEMDDDEKTLPADKVEVDLALSAHANARRWYELKKSKESKQEKTVTAHEKAFKAAERKTRLQLSQEKAVATISHMRKVHWFEKFNWFISSENYLVISGRDAQQNEMIVKRYMSKGDLYVHADLHGASSTVVKNHRPEQPVPPLTLNQAGCYTVCQSAAWDSKMVTSAWWVYPHQVSKTAPTGEYLTVGSFMIRGKKNFLPPHPLIMGFGLLFRLDESSLGSHLNERRVRGEEEGTNDADESGPLSEVSDSESEKDLRQEKILGESQSVPDSSKHVHKPEDISSQNSLPTTPTTVAKQVDSNSTRNILNDVDQDNAVDVAVNGVAPVTPQLEDLIDRALGLGSASMSVKNYKVETSPVDSVAEQNVEENKATVKEKAYISKAERRKLKKGQSVPEDVKLKVDKVKENVSVRQPENEVNDKKPGGGKTSRGQRGKLKKIKEKYADQDEEERRIRMALLASAGNVQKKGESQNGEIAQVEDKKPGPEEGAKICYKCKKVGHLSRDCQEHQVDTSDSHANGGVDHPNALDKTTSELDKVTIEEDDIHEIGEEEKEKLNDVDYLTGNPLPSDILLYAVPVCGPYNAVQSYKYRVKIIPGSVKRGKGAKTAMNLFSHMPDATAREKELMKACTDPELVAAIIGNVKITAAGLSQLKQKQKKVKKNAAK